MKKGILLSLGALLFVGVIGLGIWYLQEEEKVRVNKDAFIPYNSAFVLAINAEPELATAVKQKLADELKRYHSQLLVRVADSLRMSGLVKKYPYVLADRKSTRLNSSHTGEKRTNFSLCDGHIRSFVSK